MTQPRHDGFRWIGAFALLLLSGASSTYAGRLTFDLSSELAKNHGPGTPHTSFVGVCQNDQDGDCLDDGMENQLAELVKPRYYLDEDEGCPIMYLYTQVRPVSHGVDVWRVDGRVKKVNVTYYFLYEKDCNSTYGHFGDSEHVRFHLSSTNLKQWTLDSGTYWRHNGNSTFSGEHIFNIAHDVGSNQPVVAADEDSHGSWEVWSAYSSACSNEDSILGIRDCFDDDEARTSSYRNLTILHNIGGPDLGRDQGPERWRTGTPHLSVSGPAAYTMRYGRAEFWSPREKFCGWQCSFMDDGCRAPVDRCATSLDEKVDKEVFSHQSRPITPAENGGQTATYNCTFQRNASGVWTSNQVTWVYQGQNPQGHLRYTATDIGGTHYYRLWYVGQRGPQSERWILESVAPNDWQGPAQVRCDSFDVNRSGGQIIFSGPGGSCSNGVYQVCNGPL